MNPLLNIHITQYLLFHTNLPDKTNNNIFTKELGNKFFELSNHLGNAFTTLSARKSGIDWSADDKAEYYLADVQSAQDYYPFGMLMHNRGSFAENYRFGFNGMKMDAEVMNVTGSSYDFGARIYDSRIGRFLSLEPRASNFPFITPYCFAANNPIRFIDVNGEYKYDPDNNDPNNENSYRN